MPKVSPAHVEARRAEILDGARRAFGRWGYEGTTVARLEQEIGLSRGAIFHYFPNKWELFWELAQADQTRTLEAFVAGGIEAMLRTLVEGEPEWLGVYFEAVGFLRRDPKLFERWTSRTPELQQRAQEKFEELQRSGELRGDLPVDELSRFVGTIADGLVIRRSFGLDVDLGVVTTLVRSALRPQ